MEKKLKKIKKSKKVEAKSKQRGIGEMGDYEKAKELGISAESIRLLLRERLKAGQCVCASSEGV